ncbi:MAG: hypothetical protein AMXMBFR58_32650 [Phycisphaerae bacterium]|nr:hypothetical protein [Phycisphaerales bacterium]MCK6478232.1 DUF3568 domain-containing protein [Phycisphaerales bacterium]
MHAARIVLVSAAALLSLAGCTSTSGNSTDKSTATESNAITGVVTSTASVSLDSAYSAAKQAITDLQFNMVNESKDALTGNLKAKTADDKTVNVKLIKKSDTITEIVVDAGLVDRSLAQTVMDSIRRKL